MRRPVNQLISGMSTSNAITLKCSRSAQAGASLQGPQIPVVATPFQIEPHDNRRLRIVVDNTMVSSRRRALYGKEHSIQRKGADKQLRRDSVERLKF